MSPAGEGPIDILWGWPAIAEALGVSVKTARKLAAEHGLPVSPGNGVQVQTTRAALQEWANGRALAVPQPEGS